MNITRDLAKWLNIKPLIDVVINREMTYKEAKILDAIKNGASFDLPVQAKELRKDYRLSKRKLEEIIENLRVTYKHPIVAKKTKPNGYYIPKTDEERKAGVAAYRRQILTEIKNLAIIEGVNLDDYWKEKNDNE